MYETQAVLQTVDQHALPILALGAAMVISSVVNLLCLRAMQRGAASTSP